MPFTVAHAAVAPPLARLSGGRLPASALVIGAMAPDLEYLVFLQTRRTVGHSLLGLLAFCVPVSLLLLLVWHRVVKGPLARLLPRRWGHLAPALDRPFAFGSWSARAGVVAAVLVGAASHVAWDAFTHSDGAAVVRIAALRVVVPFLDVHVYTALQYGCGVLGMAFLGVAVVLWAREQPVRPVELPPARHRAVAVAGILATALALAAANVARTLDGGPAGGRTLVVAAVLGAMTGGSVAAMAYALARGLRTRPAPSGS
jgi:membrane-bound metal-dependent hydrolase YbcI (DUF457 family)